MLTYTNMLPKPVFQAARMWAQMAPDQLECVSSNDRIRALASVSPEKLTILVWSYPRELQRMQANDPKHGPSVMDIPVTVDVANVPFRSAGLSYERYALDYLHSNITTDLGRSELEKVQDVILAREAVAKASADSDFRVQTVMPLHGVSLIVLRPAERAPADVEGVPDRYQIWAGQSAAIEIRPKFSEDFPLELLPDRGSPDRWRTEIVFTATAARARDATVTRRSGTAVLHGLGQTEGLGGTRPGSLRVPHGYSRTGRTGIMARGSGCPDPKRQCRHPASRLSEYRDPGKRKVDITRCVNHRSRYG